MSCSQYGVPGNGYVGQNVYNVNFYQEPNCDMWNNSTSENLSQEMQLNLNSMMPASWNSKAALQGCNGPNSDWNRYTVTRDGALRYISSVGTAKYNYVTRSPAGRLFGTPNLLRSQPPTALSYAGEGGGPWFNDSSARQALVTPSMRSSIGCGN